MTLKSRVLASAIASFSTLLLVSTSAFAAGADGFKCESTGKCELAAQLCGEIAGTASGKNDCQTKATPAHPDFVYQMEVKIEHCMGTLPIIATLYNQKLSDAFSTGYKTNYDRAYKAAGCE